MNTTHPFDLVIGLDRSDRKADLHLIDTRTGTVQKQTVATSPEALHDWLVQLRQDHPQARVAICLEQPAANLIVFRQRIIWKCWQTRTVYKEAIYEAALKKNKSPLVGLLDQIELGKSPVKTRAKKS